MSVNRKVVTSSIIQQRQDTQAQNNLWNYVTAINQALHHNPINADNSITVEFFYAMDQTMVDQVIEAYKGEGWLVDIGVQSTAYQTYSGHTTLEFSVATP